MPTKDLIIKNTKKIFAKESLEGLTMRKLAAKSNIALSVIYHYFSTKDELLSEIYKNVVKDFNQKAENVLVTKTTKSKLRQFCEFCFDNASDYVFCHKYFISYRASFRKNPTGYLPIALNQTLIEILKEGNKLKDSKSRDEVSDAKLIMFLIQGTILEWYPQIPNQDARDLLIQKILARLETPLLQ